MVQPSIIHIAKKKKTTKKWSGQRCADHSLELTGQGNDLPPSLFNHADAQLTSVTVGTGTAVMAAMTNKHECQQQQGDGPHFLFYFMLLGSCTKNILEKAEYIQDNVLSARHYGKILTG